MQVPYSELNTQNSNDDAGWIGFPSFGDTPALLLTDYFFSLVISFDFLISSILNLFTIEVITDGPIKQPT